jgi:hypothetical protein
VRRKLAMPSEYTSFNLEYSDSTRFSSKNNDNLLSNYLNKSNISRSNYLGICKMHLKKKLFFGGLNLLRIFFFLIILGQNLQICFMNEIQNDELSSCEKDSLKENTSIINTTQADNLSLENFENEKVELATKSKLKLFDFKSTSKLDVLSLCHELQVNFTSII